MVTKQARSIVRTALPAGALALCTAAAVGMPGLAGAQEWSDATPVGVFQAGQHSWEFLIVPTAHGSNPATRLREGRPCLACHELEEEVIGEVNIEENDYEPEPLEGMPAWIELQVKAAIDGDNLKLQASWPAVDADSPAGEAKYATLLTFAVGRTDALPPLRHANCWAVCHADSTGMPESGGAEREKYLPNSRTQMGRTGGGDNLKSAAELTAELDKGAFLEIWQVKIAADGSVRTKDGYILDERHVNDEPKATATASKSNGNWVVELTRPLAPGEGPRHSLSAGTQYPFSISLHENHAEGRHHYVSFPHALAVEADSAEVVMLFEDTE